ncbi:MAG: hypothetical protein IJS47_00650 [Clostridia bacterium]|nr:hypothetical protein [Clostridia bacterium]
MLKDFNPQEVIDEQVDKQSRYEAVASAFEQIKSESISIDIKISSLTYQIGELKQKMETSLISSGKVNIIDRVLNIFHRGKLYEQNMTKKELETEIEKLEEQLAIAKQEQEEITPKYEKALAEYENEEARIEENPLIPYVAQDGEDFIITDKGENIKVLGDFEQQTADKKF